ncbi:unnamed protein product [Protopolystoma xenopodis]|uniref:Uncharacterized protein n=1 Tax=Protopolystoma xenopodis TaxID=117903 RepID=A0A3S5AXZ1_9PLAT|nr:unnamed protein product [Protopolystoma xenopodis]
MYRAWLLPRRRSSGSPVWATKCSVSSASGGDSPCFAAMVTSADRKQTRCQGDGIPEGRRSWDHSLQERLTTLPDHATATVVSLTNRPGQRMGRMTAPRHRLSSDGMPRNLSPMSYRRHSVNRLRTQPNSEGGMCRLSRPIKPANCMLPSRGPLQHRQSLSTSMTSSSQSLSPSRSVSIAGATQSGLTCDNASADFAEIQRMVELKDGQEKWVRRVRFEGPSGISEL